MLETHTLDVCCGVLTVIPLHCTRDLDITVDCARGDVESPALNGLALRISEIERRQIDLKRVSETTWKHDGIVEMYVVEKPC